MVESKSTVQTGEIDPELLRRFRRAVTESYDVLAKMGFGDQEGLAEYGAVGMARRHLKAIAPSEGFSRLWEMGRLHLTVEAIVLRPEYKNMFTDAERHVARERLVNKGWDEDA